MKAKEFKQLTGITVTALASRYNRPRGSVWAELQQGHCNLVEKSYGVPQELINIWEGMKQRCYNNNAPNYHNYGGRGIRMSPEWFYSYKKFYEDMNPRPSPIYSLDRINNDGDYSKENCRWADPTTQVLNSRLIKRCPGVYYRKNQNAWLFDSGKSPVRERLTRQFSSYRDAVYFAVDYYSYHGMLSHADKAREGIK